MALVSHTGRDPANKAEAPSTSFYKPMKKKQKLVFILCTSVVTFTLWLSLSSNSSSHRNSGVIITIPRLTRFVFAEPVLGDNHIIFIETSCADPTYRPSEKGIVLNPRQACSIESAARTNPLSRVYLLYTCPIEEDAFESSTAYVRHMLSYPNVRLWRLNVDEYFQGTPLELFFKMGAWSKTNWPREHSSDVLRYLTLWKYGGTYIDLDVVVRRSFSDLGVNFAGAESDELLASCVLNFGSNSIGREVAKQCLEELSTDFRGYDWGYNGPGLITRVMGKICNTNTTSEMTPPQCSGFTIHPSPVFFPVLYHEHELPLLFDPQRSEQTMRRMEHSYTVHIWNKLSIDKPVVVGSQQPYGLLAEEFCPEVYKRCGMIF